MLDDIPPSVANLHGDQIRLVAGGTVRIDAGGDAIVEDGEALTSLDVAFWGSSSNTDRLGIATTGSSRIVLSDGSNPNSTVGVRMPDDSIVVIGILAAFTDQSNLSVNFNANASPALVQELLRALTYTNTSPDTGLMAFRDIDIVLSRGSENQLSTINATIAPPDAKILTSATDHLVGTAGADVFSAPDIGFTIGDEIAGGEGEDTLQLFHDGTGNDYFSINRLAAFSSIEIVRGSAGSDSISMRGDQLADVDLIDGMGGEDHLHLAGPAADLSGKSITNIEEISFVQNGATLTVDSKAIAALVSGIYSVDETLVLTGDSLTGAERTALHRRGIDTVTAVDAATQQIRTSTATGPQVAALDGDEVAFRGQAVFIDAGRNAIVTADAGVSYLVVSVNEPVDERDRLGIDTNGRIRLSNGLAQGSRVSVDGIEIGILSITNADYLTIGFNETVSDAQVQEVVRSLTYVHTDGQILAEKSIRISLGDSGARENAVTVTVEPGTTTPPPAGNHAPTGIALNATSVTELVSTGTVVGTLLAQDRDANEAFTYTILGADGRFVIQGDKLVVANGVALDFEQARSHKVTVRATDKSGLSVDRSFDVSVLDRNPETTSGTSGADIIVGGVANDRLGGGLGNDTLIGGAGNDTLTGGARNDRLAGGAGKDLLSGNAGKDAFVFDTRPNARTNLDKIKGFSVKDDTILLDNGIFTKIGRDGALKKGAFHIGEAAHDKSDRIILNKLKGEILYDQDGIGGKAAVAIVKLDNASKLALTHKDFFVI